MYRIPASLRSPCACCGRLIAHNDADLVPFGTGYRCVRCSVEAQVTERLSAWRNDRVRRAVLGITGVMLIAIPLLLA
jgi:hypothetical protein